jgi:hypothetical protein
MEPKTNDPAVRFMARNGRHSVLERPLYGAKRPQVSY